MSVFAYYAQYYDLLYRDKDYAGEARFVADLLRRHCPSAAMLLELGCGTGLHAVLLGEAGYSVHGIDASADMVTRAEARRAELGSESARRLQFIEADIRDYDGAQRYDAAVSLFHVMSYQTGNDDVLRALGTAKRCVRPGGVFVFDCWYGPAVLEQRPEVRVKRWEDDNLRIQRFAEPVSHPNIDCVDVHYQILATDSHGERLSEVREVHRMRYFFMPEVELLLRIAGLSLEWHGEWLTGGALSTSTWNACFVARVL